MRSTHRIPAFLIILFFVCPVVISGQDILERRIVLPDTTCELYGAFLILENETGYRFSYNSDLIPSHRQRRLTGVPKTLKAILDELIDNPAITCKVIGNQIVLFQPDLEVSTHDSLQVRVNSYIFIRGTVMDHDSRKPVAYASIGLTGRNAGTISNNDGEFVMKVSSDDLDDTLAVSFLGYKTYTAPVNQLPGEGNRIYLYQDFIPIQEVIIRKTEPVYLITSALNRIRDNYPPEPTRQTAFYRETIQKNNRYIMVSEAILSIYKPGYVSEYEAEQVKIIMGRRNIDTDHSDTVGLKMKAGLNTSLVLDVIKSLPDFLNREALSQFRYSMSDIMFYNNEYTYAIDFVQKDNTAPPHYQGTIFIDMNSLAIVGAEFELIPDKIDEAASLLVVRKPPGLTVKPLSARYKVSYSGNNNKFYLNLIRTENVFRIRRNGRLFGNTFTAISELAVTRTDTLDVSKFRRKELARTDDIFADMVGGYEPSFWGEFNYIVPDEPLEEALIRINDLLKEE